MTDLIFTSAEEIIERYPDCADKGSMGLVTDLTATPPRAFVVCCGETFAVTVDELRPLHSRGYFCSATTAFLMTACALD